MVLTYHEIFDRDVPYAYGVSAGSMREHLAFLSALPAGSSLGAHPPISFDDGHASHHRYGLPLLREYGIRGAIFFVVPGWLESRSGYANWSQVKEIAANGHQVQSHSWSHPFLAHCDTRELRRELEMSKSVLEDRLGATVDAISVPGGSWDWRVVSACAAAGYKRVYLSDPWFGVVERDGVQVIGRLMVRRTMTSTQLLRFFEAESKRFSLLRLPHRIRRIVRKALGDRLYHRLWKRVVKEATRGECNLPVPESVPGAELE